MDTFSGALFTIYQNHEADKEIVFRGTFAEGILMNSSLHVMRSKQQWQSAGVHQEFGTVTTKVDGNPYKV